MGYGTHIRALLAGIGLLLALGGCGTPGAPQDAQNRVRTGPPGEQSADPLRVQVIFTAMQQVGVPYRWGGSSPKGFDCSGLVQYAFGNAGLPLPRTAEEQLATTRPVTLEDAEAGDLLFFRERGRTSHVAIYLGDGRFVHAPSSGKSVSIESFGNSHWRSRFARAGRVPPL